MRKSEGHMPILHNRKQAIERCVRAVGVIFLTCVVIAIASAFVFWLKKSLDVLDTNVSVKSDPVYFLIWSVAMVLLVSCIFVKGHISKQMYSIDCFVEICSKHGLDPDMAYLYDTDIIRKLDDGDDEGLKRDLEHFAAHKNAYHDDRCCGEGRYHLIR